MTVTTLKASSTKVLAAITLVVMVAPLFPPVTFAQDATPGPDSGTTSIAQSSDEPAPSSLDFNVNPDGSSPSISPDTSVPNPTVDAVPSPSPSSLSSPQTESITP